jgi:hypothetical protein
MDAVQKQKAKLGVENWLGPIMLFSDSRSSTALQRQKTLADSSDSMPV